VRTGHELTSDEWWRRVNVQPPPGLTRPQLDTFNACKTYVYEAGLVLLERVPISRTRSHALGRLEEAMMWTARAMVPDPVADQRRREDVRREDVPAAVRVWPELRP
jgi:hypothetical protein